MVFRFLEELSGLQRQMVPQYQAGVGTVANQKRHAYVKSAASIQLLPIIAMNTFRPCVPKSLIPSPCPPKSRNLDQYEKQCLRKLFESHCLRTLTPFLYKSTVSIIGYKENSCQNIPEPLLTEPLVTVSEDGKPQGLH